MKIHRDEFDVLSGVLIERPARGRVVQITGEPWIGKTSLLVEFCAKARELDYAVAFGRVSRCRSLIPFEPFVDALDNHLLQGAATDSSTAYDEALMLSSVFPFINGGTQHLASDTPVHDHNAFRAIRYRLQQLAGTLGLVVALDDFHRADASSMELLDYLIRHPPTGPVLLVVAYRSSLAGRRVNSLISRARPQNAVYVDLAPLAEEEVAGLLPSSVTKVGRQLLRRDARDNLGALLSLYSAQRAASDLTEDYAADDLVDGPPPLAPDASLIDFEALSTSARRTAMAAAVCGDPFDLDIVAAAAQIPEEVVLAGIDELQDEGLVELADVNGRLRFQHPVGRAAAYHSANAGWCYGAKSRAAAVLESRGAPPGVLAPHIEHLASCNVDVQDVLLQGAKDVLCTMPYRARRWLCRILESPGKHSAEVPLLLAKAYALSGRLADSLRMYRDNWHRLDAVTLLVRTDSIEWCVRVHRLMGFSMEARQLLEKEFASRAERQAPVSLRLEYQALLIGAGDRLTGVVGWEPPSAVDDPDPALRGQALSLLALLLLQQNHVADAGDVATEAAALVSRIEDKLLAVRAETLLWLAEAETRLGRLDEAAHHLHRGLDFAVEHGHGYLQPALALALADVHTELNDLREAEANLQYAEAASQRWGAGPMLAALAQACDEMRCKLGDRGVGRLRSSWVQPNGNTNPNGGRRRSGGQDVSTPTLVVGGEPATHNPTDAGDSSACSSANLAIRCLSLLSQREQEVARFVSLGCTNQQIANRLKLSQKTVETYLSRIFKKLDISSRAQIAHAVGQADIGV